MIKQWLTWLNYALVGIALTLGVATGVVWIKRPGEIVNSDPQAKKVGLPKSAFELPAEHYHDLGESILALNQAPPTLQVPDLKQQLIYYGKNGRPDAQENRVLLHFAIGQNKTITSMPPNQRYYLVYDRSVTPSRYTFSPNNEKTTLWIEGSPVDNEVQVKVTMLNEKGEEVSEPEANAQFRLPEKEFARTAGASWEIGSFRVDGTLLARQKARWYGFDRFLEHHGGNEFQHSVGKQRIDFGEGDAIYSVFAKIGDSLIWEEDKWKVVPPGEQSLGRPLMVVKKVDERLMSFELWDVEGKGKIVLNLLKSSEPWPLQNPQALQPMFKFVAARTRTQAVFEVNRERMVLTPSDWLLLTPKGWKRLVTEEDIDNYVKRKVTGTLFVFEGLGKKDDKQVMKGKLYSPGRHDYQEVEVALQANNTKPTAASKEGKDNKESKDGKEAKEAGQAAKETPAPLMRGEGDKDKAIGQAVQTQIKPPVPSDNQSPKR